LVTEEDVIIMLPDPRYDGRVSVEEALLKRRSIRDYTAQSLTLKELAQLLWAAQGTRDPGVLRTAPSAGATYPLKVYAVVGDGAAIAGGIYSYNPQTHRLLKVVDGDKRSALAAAAIDQQFITRVPVNLVITAVYERTTDHYGQRGIRYVDMEAGHVAQNVYLQAVALGLGVVVVGAFDDSGVADILKLPENEKPLYIIPVGTPA
jgi:SagB-type dehydrogenase family enzyme